MVYLRLVKKWWWLVILAAVAGGGVSFAVSKSPISVYRADTTITVGRFFDSPNPSSYQISVSSQLVTTYQQIIQTQAILQGALDTLGLSTSVEDLRKRLSTYLIPETSLLVVSIIDTNEARAGALADEIANQLIAQSPTNLSDSEREQVALAREQIELLSDQLDQGRQELADIDEEMQYATSVEDIARLTAQRSLVVNQINDASATMAQFSGTIVSIEQRANQLGIIEHAQITQATVGTSRSISAMLGAFAGVIVAIMGILLMEYLDDRFKAPEDVASFLEFRILGGIPRYGKKKDDYSKRLLDRKPELAQTIEAFRSLRVNLLHSGDSGKSNIFIVTSSGPQEGKSVTISNLAMTIAESGLQVLLIDADLRNPTLHKVFQLSNEVGLTNLLSEKPLYGSDQLRNGHREQTLEWINAFIQPSPLENLKILTSGFIPANPTEILGSARMRQWIDTFVKEYNFDVILIDTPPAMIAADASALAVNVGAEVVVLIDIMKTKRGIVLKVKENLSLLGVQVRGVILSKTSLQGAGYSYGASKHYYTNNFSGRYVDVKEIIEEGMRDGTPNK